MNTISARVGFVMTESQMSTADIIRKGGPSRATVWRILNDSSYAPETYTLERLAEALGVSSEWLISGKGSMTADRAAESRNSYQAEPGLDLQALALALETLEAFLAQHRKKLAPAAKAQTVAQLYATMRLWRPEALTAANVTPLLTSMLAS